MQLRNGKIYKTDNIVTAKKTYKYINLSELNYDRCSICCEKYYNNQIISTCNIELKHHYHDKCLKKSFISSKEVCHNPIIYENKCPYCRKKIPKKYFKFKIIKKNTI
jgi:hypothetical protein